MAQSKSRWLAAVLVACAVPLAARAGDDAPAAVELLQRREQLAADDIAGHIALAEWCEQRDLANQAAEFYQQVVKLDTDQDDAYQRLVKIRDTTRLPENAKRQEKLQKQFGDEFALYVTSHFLIFYQADEQWMRNRAALLEKAHDVFYSTFRRYDYRVLPLDKRLVCVLFADHDSYAAYARQREGIDVGWMTGYYSRATNDIQFYDDRTAPHFKPVIDRVAQLEKANEQLVAQLRQARRDRNHAVALELQRRQKALLSELTWYRNRHEAIARIGDAAKTVHEAVHQFAFNSGLQSNDHDYPFWLLEGLSTNFETDDPAKPFGPLQDSEFRPRQVRELMEKNALVELSQFVAMRQAPADSQMAHVAYCEAFALYRFLFRYESKSLQQYMKTIREGPPGPRTGEQMRNEFIAAFGSIESLSDRFVRYVQRLE